MTTKPHEAAGAFVGEVRNTGSSPLGTFQLKLTLNRVDCGWVGRGGSQGIWATIVDQADAQTFQWYAYGGVTYLIIPNFGYMTWSGGLSGSPIAINSWAYACGWDLQNGQLYPTGHPDMPMSVYDTNKGWLYANNGYSILGVTRVDL